jgi:hypothetical protein
MPVAVTMTSGDGQNPRSSHRAPMNARTARRLDAVGGPHAGLLIRRIYHRAASEKERVEHGQSCPTERVVPKKNGLSVF